MKNGSSSRIPLLDGEAAADPWWCRWWVLGVYSYASGLQGLLWMTYSSVPDASKAFLGCGDGTLNTILIEGPIAYVLVVVFASWLFTTAGGLKRSVLAGCSMCAFAAALRCLPALLLRDQGSALAMALVYAAQFINAGAAPFTQASPALISQAWFPLEQRGLATAIARQSNSAGRAVGFFLAPALVSTKADLPRFLYVELGVALLPLLCALAYFPAGPRRPPTRSAASLSSTIAEAAKPPPRAAAASSSSPPRLGSAVGGAGGAGAGTRAEVLAVLRDGLALLRQRSRLAMLVGAFGLQMGVYGAWSGILPQVLKSGGSGFTSTDAGTLGSVNTFAGIAGGVLAGYLADTKALSTRLRLVMMVLCAASFAAFAAFAFMVQRPQLGDGGMPSFVAIAAVSTLAGGFRGGLDPLFFELSTELAHPVPPGTVGGLLTMYVHLVMIAFLAIPSGVLDSAAMLSCAVTMLVCGAMVASVRETYNRRRLDLGNG